METRSDPYIKHEFGDGCPALLDLGTVKGASTYAFLVATNKYPLNCIRYDLGLSKLLIPFETIKAQKKIREHINTTPEQTVLSEFHEPSIFDSNKYPPDTIVKLSPLYRVRSSVFHNDSTRIPLYDHKTKTVTEVPRGWVETQRPTEKLLAKVPHSFLGVIRRIPGIKDYMIFAFENNQQKIMSKNMSPYIYTNAIALGMETHIGVEGKYFNKTGFRIDLITSMEKAEILAMGTPVKEKSKVPAERNPATAKGFSYYPT